jgi:peptidoglycan LD-endopeptidase LytH
MTRIGWTVAGLFALLALGLTLTTSWGGVRPLAVLRPVPKADPLPAGGLVMPVAGVSRAALADSWGDARGGGARAHQGLDIMAPARQPVIAAGAGTVEKLFQSKLGGTTLYLRSADGRWTYYYAHLAGYAAGLHEGLGVRAGQLLGYVGDTGDAGPGHYHLHFGISRMRPGERWWQGEPVNPYPILARSAASR